MITTLSEFDDSSSFERGALAEVYPLLGTGSARMIDLRGNGPSRRVKLFGSDVIGEGLRLDLINKLRPLLIGAAWKTLDLLLELAFHHGGLIPQNGRKWTIAEKQKNAAFGAGLLLPLSDEKLIWSRLCALFANTVELRHCLVHRRFTVDPAGDITDIRDQSGAPQQHITVGEQKAICRLIQRSADAALTSTLTVRARSDLIWWLDQLTNHHRHGAIGLGYESRPAPIIQLDASPCGNTWTVNLALARTDGKSVFKEEPYFDLEVHFPGTELLPVTAHLEDAPPDDYVSIDPYAPPSWIYR